MNRPASRIRRRDELSIVIPCFNEEDAVSNLAEKLLPVIERLERDWIVRLIFVDDGSSDDTYVALRAHFMKGSVPEATILRHFSNRGIGAALATGFEAATGRIVCTFDSDCTYDPAELPALIDRLERSGADIATGSPYHPAGGVDNVPAWRLALSKSASGLYRFVGPVRLHCYTSLFRAYRRPWACPDLFMNEDFLGVTEILLAAADQGATIVEHPVRLGVRDFGQSKMRIVEITAMHLKLMARTLAFRLGLGPNPLDRPIARARLELEESRAGRNGSGLIDQWVLVGRFAGDSRQAV